MVSFLILSAFRARSRLGPSTRSERPQIRTRDHSHGSEMATSRISEVKSSRDAASAHAELRISASSRRRRDSWPSHFHESGFFCDFELFRTASMASSRDRCHTQASRAASGTKSNLWTTWKGCRDRPTGSIWMSVATTSANESRPTPKRAGSGSTMKRKLLSRTLERISR